MKYINLFNNFKPISENLKYHVDNNLPVLENVFRPGSTSFFDIIKEARELFDNKEVELCGIDKILFETTDLGKFELFEGEMVPLDLPLEVIEEINEAEYKGKKVSVGKPMRNTGSGKKYYVYVKNPKTKKIIKVSFGDAKGGLSAKVSDPKARKAFASRHQCHLKKDRTKPGYWSCRANRYANLWNGRTYPGYW
jgi:hypothetical protein